MKNLGKEVIISPRFTSDEWGVKQLSDQPVVSGISARRRVTDSLNWALITHYQKKDSTQNSVSDSMHRVINRLQGDLIDTGDIARRLVSDSLREIYTKPYFF